MFIYNILAIFWAVILTVVQAIDDLPNVFIGDPNDPSSDIVGPPISDAEFKAALANKDLLTYQPDTNSTKTNYTYFQGDIIIKYKDHLTQMMSSNKTGRQRSAISRQYLKWPNATIPYVISSSFSDKERAVIVRAMEEYHQETCIKFLPWTTQSDYIHILKGYGCSSLVGRHQGRHIVSLGYGCVTFATVIHELMHAAGFWHEQSRYDRDDYVTINYQNIENGTANHNFFKKTPSVTQDLGLTYDYSSVMHYAWNAFAIDPRLPTIIPKKQGVVIGNEKGFSQSDKKGLNLLYKCKGTTTPKPKDTTTPKPSGKCVDRDQHCSYWANKGLCNRYTEFMHANCRKSCNKCGSTIVAPCVDKDAKCHHWAKFGYCVSKAASVIPKCPKSCNTCACVDMDRENCSIWASIGVCKSNPLYMHVNCRKSCNKCI